MTHISPIPFIKLFGMADIRKPPTTATDESSALLAHSEEYSSESSQSIDSTTDEEFGETPKPARVRTKFGVLAVLLIGAFISNIDSSLVLATYGNISSHFHDFESGRWIFTSSTVAQCAVQPLYGKLSNIYGRKAVLLLTYVFFGLGAVISGAGQSMQQIIIGRIVGGTGAAGMVSLVSILISDLVPMKEIATYRSYVNVISTTGRSIGGPLGGFIAQKFGWRWSFYFEFPIAILAFVLVAWQLKLPKHPGHIDQTKWAKFKRIDFLGSLCLSTAIVALLLSLDFSAKAKVLSDPLPILSIAAGMLLIILFCIVEKFWAKEPIFPLTLLTDRDAVCCYAILGLHGGAQLALMSTIPLYFQITQGDSPGKAGAYLVSAVLGNTVGGLATGVYIQRAGRYKLPIVLAGVSGAVTYSLLAIRWNGHTNFLESLYVFGGGLGFGTAYSATFVAVAAAVTEEEFAIAGSGLYMFSSIGVATGISISGAVFKYFASKGLFYRLGDVKNGLEIAHRSLEDIGYINSLKGRVHELVVAGYIEGFKAVFIFSLVFASIAFVISLTVRQYKLRT